MVKKLVFIENVIQAKEFLKNKEKYKDFKIITFTYPVEKFMLENGFQINTEDDYEDDNLYKGLYNKSKLISDELCEKILLKHEDIPILPIFYTDIKLTIALTRKYYFLIKKIIELEKPEKIVTFFDDSSLFLHRNFSSKIITQIFSKEIIKENYVQEEQSNKVHRLAEFIQNIISRTKMKLLKKTDKKIFFSGPKNLFENVFDELLNDKKNKLFRFHGHLQKSFFVNGKYIPFFQFYHDSNIEIKIKREINELKKEFESLNLAKLKNPIEEEISQLLKEEISKYVLNQFPEVASWINQIIKLIRKKKIDMVLLDNDLRTFEKTIVSVTKKYNIPSLIFQHGALCYENSVIPINADYMMVYGPNAKRFLIKHKIPQNKIIQIGAPKFDKFNIYRENTNEKLIVYAIDSASSYNLIPDIILTKKRQKEILRKIFRVMKKFPEYKLIIKTRVVWDMEGLPEQIAREEKYTNYEIIEETDNFELLNRAKLILVHQSTMGLEGVMIGKPAISISYKDMNESSIYTNNRATFVAYDEKELETFIKKSLNPNKDYEKEKEKYLKDHFINLDSKASYRAKKFIEGLLNK